MLQLIPVIFIATIGVLTFLASIGQLLVKNRRFENYNLWVLFLIISIVFFQASIAMFTDIVFAYPAVLFLHLTSLYLLGVILYFAYRLVCDRSAHLPDAVFFYFIPSCAALIFDIIFLMLSESEKILILKNIYYGEPYRFGIFIKPLFFGAGVQCIILSVWLIKDILKKLKSKRGVIVLHGITITYIVLSAAAINLIVTAYAVKSRSMITAVYIVTGFLMIGTFLVSHRYPSFLQLVMIESGCRKYPRSGPDAGDIDRIKNKLTELMEKEKLFAEENISLLELADEIGISSHQLSRFLNEHMNMSFYSFINHHRVQEAVRIIKDNKDMTVLSIAYEVGFNSKSSFYSAFFKFTGKTPNQYKKSILKSASL